MRTLSIGLSAMALMAVSVAHAQTPNSQTPGAPPPPPAGHHAMPMKELTRDEAKTRAEKLFDALDLNHDGKLDKADRDLHLAKHFEAMDANHDGQLSLQEFQATHERMKGPKDGPEEQAPGRWKQEGRGPEGHNGMGQRGPAMMLMMRQADPNHTGTVTRDAFVNAALATFDREDTNHDGKVTPEERRAAMRAEMGGGQGRRGPGGPGGHHRGGPDGQGPDMPPPPPAGQ